VFMKNEKYYEHGRHRGLIFNIQRYSVQDGPGIRTTIFMKGCPLNCSWCSNPESWEPYPELIVRDIKCIRCGKCIQVCPAGAISLDVQDYRKIDRAKCDLCFKCVDVCPSGALSKVGKYMTVNEVMEEIEPDEIFYRNSGGGITVSGGEPLLQWEFAYELLRACKQKHFHTALDTCGYARWSILEKILNYVDLVLYDIKHIDAKLHKKGTGKNNTLILNNARRISNAAKLWIRVPLIAGYNDSPEHMRGIAELAKEVGAEKVSLLPYHELGREKYFNLGRAYNIGRFNVPSNGHIQLLKDLIESLGVKVTVGS